MAQRRYMTALRPLAMLLVAGSSIVCGGSQSGPGSPSGPGEVDLLERVAPKEAGPLVFPPPDEPRKARGALPHEFLGNDTSVVAVVKPALDGDGAFHLDGRELRVVFNQAMTQSAAQAALTITPAVAGDARWVDDHTIEFSAAKPFDPEAKYAIEMGKLTSATGKPLGATWRATFTATPSVTVAGKVLSYLPRIGRHRLIATHPLDDATIGRSQELSVLYDQPIDLGVARSLVTLEDDLGRPLEVVLDHPKGPTFQGIKVDPRLVVLVRPKVPLQAGQKVKLGAGNTAVDDKGRDRKLTLSVAEPLARTEVACGYADWDDGEACSFDAGRLVMSGNTLHVTFNNPIDMSSKELVKHVQTAPPVRNLTVSSEGWDDGRIVLRGAFDSSKTYRVFISGLVDRYGGRLREAVAFEIRTRSLGASVAMPEGLIALDQTTTKRFTVTTRNVRDAEIRAWPIPAGDAEAWSRAMQSARTHGVPEEPSPIRIPVSIRAERDRMVDTSVDLSSKLAAGTSYVATLAPVTLMDGAERTAYPRGSEAEAPSVALLTAWSPNALAVNARSLPDATVVQVSKLGTGEPVAGASVRFGGADAPAAVATDANGVAWLGAAAGGTVQVAAAGTEAYVSLDEGGVSAKQLFPDLAAGGTDDAPPARRAMITSDRGIYRPGSTVMIKASVRVPEGERLAPAANAQLRVRVLGPTGDEVFNQAGAANDMGSVATSYAIPTDAKLGRHQLRVEDPDHADPPLAQGILQVAEFEPPRFAVDIDAGDPAGPSLKATVRARYLFGAPMDGAQVSWTLKREAAPFPDGPLTAAGLVFRKQHEWYEDDDTQAWTRAGSGQLAADGTLAIEQALPLAGAEGPQAFVLEADVTDSSYRHIAGRTSITKHPRTRYAGLRLATAWAAIGEPMQVSLGVIDTTGKPVVGTDVTAKMVRVDWRYTERRLAGGAVRWDWRPVRTEVGRCSAKSAAAPVSCELIPSESGDYEVTADVDGEAGATVSFWAWHEGDDARTPFPSRGRALEVVTDKPSYAAGETAHLLVRNPYPAATAILTVEQGGLLERRALRVTGGAAVLDVPVSAAYAPYVHAAVTLLPIGAKGDAAFDYRIGAARIPVSMAAARLELAAKSDRPTYEPGEEAEITVDVKDHGKPDEGAEIALAIVDEGVLRLTSFHAPDPVTALRPGRALSFHMVDSRQGLAELLERSHVAGDGGGPEASTIASTRKNFVETALWKPDLRTDASGRARVKFKLPDNLTEFRVMAVVLDRDGKGASSESSFTVKKPVMLVPVVPRFASVGDRFDVAAMLHNNTDAPLAATVMLGDRKEQVTVPGGGHTRVGFPFTAGAPGTASLRFAVADATGKVRDQVEAKLPVDEPGLEEHPRLAGTFAKDQEIALLVPASAVLHGGESLRVQAGQRLWPELGARLDYLLGYPHGCVEQTTSSTLPLLAARAILPRIGVEKLTEGQLTARIRVGLERLRTMRTSSGGLAYWPGGSEPNVYGTAYAMRAVVLADKAGIKAAPGLLDGMKRYLADEMLSSSTKPEVAAAIAQSLGELGELPKSAADALYDKREGQSVFGQASLAVALGALGGQEDRVAALLDAVEQSLDEQGNLNKPPRSDDFYYYGSPTRSRAQAAIALSRLRRTSKVLPALLSDLASHTDTYTTQGTAYSLLAVAEQLTATPGDGASVRVMLDGAELTPSRDLGFGSKEFTIPVAALRGKKASLHLVSEGEAAVGFLVTGAWRTPLSGAGSLTATRPEGGPEVFRMYTDAKGGPVDLSHVHAGDVVRVALLARMPIGEIEHDRLGYLAVTDRLPAGFEPVQPDLATVASVPDLSDAHPLASLLRWGSSEASHVELHDDRVNLYFDRVYGEYVAATYLARASTPGQFVAPPAAAELMYEGGSLGYSESTQVIVQ